MSKDTLNLTPNYDAMVQQFTQNAKVEFEYLSDLITQLAGSEPSITDIQKLGDALKNVFVSLNIAAQASFTGGHLKQLRDTIDQIKDRAQMLEATL